MVGKYSEAGEVVLIDPVTDEAWHLPLVPAPDSGTVNASHIGTYPPKQVIGDWTRASHEVLSSYVQSDTTGGGQIRDANESTDQGRFWFGTADTQWPHQIVLPPLTTTILAPGDQAVAMLLGDYQSTCLAAFDTTLCQIAPSGATVVGTALAAPPVARGVPFQGTGTLRFFIPLGVSGLQTWDGTAVGAVDATIPAVALLEYDTKLYAFCTDGTIRESLDGTTFATKVTIDGSHTPRFLIGFYDRQGNPALHAVTNRAVFGIDLSVPKAYQTQLAPPPHPDAALAGDVWRTDLYVSYGIGVHRYTGDTISAMGLDRDDGLPKEYRGSIVGLANGYNALYALVRGIPPPTGTESFISDLSRKEPVFPTSNVASLVMLWNGFGWHTVWSSNGIPPATAHNILISTAGDGYRLWWSYGATLYTVALARTFFNPRQRTGTETFAPSATLEYSTLDMDMTGLDKIYASIELRTQDCTPTETITVDYKFDDGDWQTLGTITGEGEKGTTRLRLGAHGTFPGVDDLRFDGVPADRITVRVTLDRDPDDATKTPILESMAIIFHKVMGTLSAYQFTVDCTNVDQYPGGRTARERQLFLDRLLGLKQLIPMQHQGVWRTVRLAGVSGRDRTGQDVGGDRTVAVLSVWDDVT